MAHHSNTHPQTSLATALPMSPTTIPEDDPPRMRRLILGLALLCTFAGLAGWHGAQASAATGIAGETALQPFVKPHLQQAATTAQAEKGSSDLWLPLLNYQVGNDVCETWVEVQNVGATHGGAILVAWSTDRQDGTIGAEACSAGCDGPMEISCSGMLAPGSTWSFFGAHLPTGAASGLLLPVSVAPLAELGGSGATPAISALCAALRGHDGDEPDAPTGGARRDCGIWQAFHSAWRAGGTWRDLPLGEMRGAKLAATAHRTCPGGRTPGVETTSAYPALPEEALHAARDASGTYRNVVLGARRDQQLGDSTAYVQNAGDQCAHITLWLAANEECGRPTEPCAEYRLEPGQAVNWHISARGGPNSISIAGCPEQDPFGGRMWLESDQPLAIASDLVEGDLLTTHVGIPLPASAPGASVESEWQGSLPLLLGPSEQQSQVRVWVGSEGTEAIEAEFQLDIAGLPSPITGTLELCGRGSGELILRTPDLPHATAGLLRVTARPAAEGGALGHVMAMAEVVAIDSGFRSRSAYRANIPPRVSTPSASFALGAARNDLRGTGILDGLLLANVAQASTEIVVRLYDTNGPAAHLCRTLGPGETLWLPMSELPQAQLDVGFVGSAIVEAVAWADEPPANGEPFALTAAVLTHKGTTAERDVPGDEAALVAAIPIDHVSGGEPPWPGAGASPPCPAPGEPDRDVPAPTPAESAMAWLPALHVPEWIGTCDAAITVRNDASSPQIAVLVDWGSPGWCPPKCNGPQSAYCSPLLAPGGTWQPTELDVAADSNSAVVLGLSPDSLDALGVPPGGTEPAANLLCRTLASVGEDPRGPCPSWTELLSAWTAGGPFAGLPMDRLVGGPISVSVSRSCVRSRGSTTPIEGSYEAPTAARPSTSETWPGRFVASVFPLYATAEAALPGEDRIHGLNSLIHIQNIGTSCTSVDVIFESAPPAAGGACQPTNRCSLHSLAPGEVYLFDANDCMGPHWSGFATLFSNQPLAIVTHVQGDDRGLTYPAAPWKDPFDLDRDGDRDTADRAVIEAANGASPGDPRWRSWLDLHRDGRIDDADAVLLDLWLPSAGPPCPTSTPRPSPTSATRRTPTPPAPDPTASPSPPSPTATEGPRGPAGRIHLPWGATGP